MVPAGEGGRDAASEGMDTSTVLERAMTGLGKRKTRLGWSRGGCLIEHMEAQAALLCELRPLESELPLDM